MLERALISFAILVGCLNLIYFGCIENGSGNLRNPVWAFLNGLVTLEKYIALIALAGVAVFFIVKTVSEIKAAKQSRWNNDFISEEHSYYRAMQPRLPCKEEPQKLPCDLLKNQEVKPVVVNSSQKTIVESNKCEPIVILKTPKLTPEALKEKAIQDILRRPS